MQAPLIDEVLKEIGIEGGSLAKMGGLIRDASDMQRIGKETPGAKPKDAKDSKTGSGTGSKAKE